MQPGEPVKPMLATRVDAADGLVSLLDLGDDWAFEPKLDGYRCVFHVFDGKTMLQSRSGADVSQRFRAAALPQQLAPVVLDGELVALDSNGQVSFSAIQRAHGRPGDPVPHFLPFDLLFDPARGDVRDYPWSDRRELLQQVDSELSPVPFSMSAEEMWRSTLELGVEGVMAKRSTSRYRPGRSRDWIKVKHRRSLSALATGWIAGEGARADTFGSIELSLLDESGELKRVGKVGSGLRSHDFVALPQLQMPFVVEVEYQEWTGTALRMPIFKGVRDDIPVSACTTAQLESSGRLTT